MEKCDVIYIYELSLGGEVAKIYVKNQGKEILFAN